MTNFKVGDTVQLNSDGPEMTVEETFNDDVDCVWFNDGELRKGSFKKQMLSKT